MAIDTLPVLHKTVDRLVQIIDGDASRDVRGLRPRVETIETFIGEIRQERAAMRAHRRGVAAGLILANMFGGGALLFDVLKALGVLP